MSVVLIFSIVFIAVYLICLGLIFLKKTVSYRVGLDGKKHIFFSADGISWNTVIGNLLWALIGTFCLIYCVSLLVPVFWMLITSFKSELEFTLNAFDFPKVFHFENYINVLNKFTIIEGSMAYDLWDMLFNSLIFSTVGPTVSVFWITVTAYALSRFRFKGNKFIYNLGIVIMMFPIVGNIAAEMIFKQKIGLYDNMYVSIFIPPATPFSGMYFMIMYGVLKAIPMAYTEAARIDGANEYLIMFRIIIPMVLPTCATLFLLSFFTSWNAYESFLVWYPSTPNIAYGMYRFQRSTSGALGAATEPEILAGFALCMIPSLVLYLSSQKLITSKFTVGGIKG